MTDDQELQHSPTAEQLEGYLKGTCSPDEAAAIRAHIAECPRCREWVDDARANEVLLESVRILVHKERPSIPVTPGLNPDLQVIEGYEILEEIGRGGMGVVYKARQVGTKRTVALKILLEGPLASESTRRRFEREIELAASLSHPNIVAIHDSGLSQGRYYFAMDFIEGQRLDHFVKSRDLPDERRLRLMQKICLAVHHAHQHGVIHRDLKPSNILVDADGEPHILDFGLAKTIESSPQAESLLISLSGEVLGTLPYMAPEQALGIQRDVDSRTDVYTLGVIFYELLTGRYPYPVVGQMADVLKNIAEAVPARPSTIYRRIRNDLETIVLKTLSKEKEQRYDSAGALAADIGRYMAGEAIEAKRDSGWYVLRKTLRRHKVPAGAAAALLVAAVVVAIAMSSLYTRAEQQRQVAQAATTQAVAQRQRAETTARDLVDELHTRRIEQGRSLVLAGDIAQGEYLLWREFLQSPGDPQALWALREVYATQPCLAKALASTVPLVSVAFAPDGQRLATADTAGAVKLWEVPSCRLVSTIITQAPDATSLTFSPNGKTLALASSDQSVRLLDVTTSQCTLRLSPAAAPTLPPVPSPAGASGRPAYTLAFSPDGKILASCAGNDVILWNAADGKRMETLTAHTDRVTGVAFSPDGKSLASAGVDRAVILWDLKTDQPRHTLVSHLDYVACVAFSPDSRIVASASWDGTVILWNASDGTCLASLEDFNCWVHSVAFAPDGRTLAAGDIHGNVKLWDLATGRCTTTIPAHVEEMSEPLRPAVTLAYSPRGDTLATASPLGVLKLWDVSPSRPMLTLEGHAGGALAAAFAGDTGTLASRDQRGAVRLWDLSTGRCTRTFAGPDALEPGYGPGPDWDNPELADQQQSVAASPDGKRIAAIATTGRTIVLYDTVSGDSSIVPFSGGPASTAPASGSSLGVAPSEVSSFGVPPSGGAVSFLSLAFSSDGKTFAAGSSSGQIRLWDAASLQLVRTIEARAAVSGLRFSPDSRLIAVASDRAVNIFDAASGKHVIDLAGHLDRVRALAFSPDGRTLASAAADGVFFWEVPSGRRMGVLEGEAGPVYSLAFSPDGRTLACSAHNRTIRLWQVPSGRCIATLQTGERLAWSLAFSPDGRMLACGGAGNSLRLFNLAHYDRNVLGNYPFYLELAHRSPEQLEKISREDLDRWAKDWAAEAELPLWASPADGKQPSGDAPVDLAQIADWGQLTRHRLLTALRTLGHRPIEARLPVAGAMDPPTVSVIFSPAPGDTRVHTLLGSGSSLDRTRAAEYQRQRLNGLRPAAASQPAPRATATPPA
jgi:WD40 repeat protein/predicted Ser/Thr protein kinase